MNKLFSPEFGAWTPPLMVRPTSFEQLWSPRLLKASPDLLSGVKASEQVLKSWVNEIRKEVLFNEGDWLFANTGKVNSGKSNTTFFLAELVEPTFLKQTSKLERVCFAMNDYDEYITEEEGNDSITRGKVVDFDEGAAVALASEFNTKESRAFKRFYMFNREIFGLYTFINIPNLEYLDRYFRINRIDTLVDCVTKYDKRVKTDLGSGLSVRGFANFYSGKKAKQIRKDASTGEWTKPSPSFTHNRIPNFKEIDEEHKKFWKKYKEKKLCWLTRQKIGDWDYSFLDKGLKPKQKKLMDDKAKELDRGNW